MTFEDLEKFYRDYKNGIITLDGWIAVFRIITEDIMEEYERLLAEGE